MDWFAVDKEGLASLLERKGKSKAVLELVQNAWDAPGVSKVTVELRPEGRGKARLIVSDDSPEGFKDLTHAFTLFAPSEKITDATKRGRFNLGEKLVLAVCDYASVISTSGTYSFTQEGRHHDRKNKTTAGSIFDAVIRLNKDEQTEVATYIRTLLPPDGVETTFNGEALQRRTPVLTFTANLRTEVADDDRILRPTRRNTEVRLFETLGDEEPHIYELGIPVVEYDGRWHVDVAQKVPLSFERDNVTPAYLRDLMVAIVNNTHSLLTEDDVNQGWVREAAADPRTEDVAIIDITTKRWGDQAVAYDPSDKQANAEAILQGYAVIHGRNMSKDEWDNVRRVGLIRPAGQVTPSNNTVELSTEGKPPVPEVEWTAGIQRIAEYSKALAKELLGVDIRVTVTNSTDWFLAAYSPGHLIFNLMRLGHRWFNEPDPQAVDALLLHEFAHHRVSDHLSEEYHRELCRLGASLRGVVVHLVEEGVVVR